MFEFFFPGLLWFISTNAATKKNTHTHTERERWKTKNQIAVVESIHPFIIMIYLLCIEKIEIESKSKIYHS